MAGSVYTWRAWWELGISDTDVGINLGSIMNVSRVPAAILSVGPRKINKA